MRAPPPVEFRSAPGGAWRAALYVLVGVAVAVTIAWALAYLRVPGGPALQAAVVLACSAAGIVAVRQVRGAGDVGRTLLWDGQDWVLARDGEPDRRGDATLMLDLGPWMLVRFRSAGTAGGHANAWLPLAATGDAAHWAALRGALWNARAHEAGR
jgi:hypothetical protein